MGEGVKEKPRPVPLAEVLEQDHWNGKNYGGPNIPCGMCKRFFDQATMLVKDAEGKPLDPHENKKCSLHPNAPGGGKIHITRDTKIKCGHFWMKEIFFRCVQNDKRNITPRACAWRHKHYKDNNCPECKDCAMGKRMFKWMEWHKYNVPDGKNTIMKGMVEERKAE